ncbi:unnamed protein product [Effrenium voratum]|nr:unnamed protein product [Effrenium voratum]
MRRALSRKPESSVGLIVCPHLTSSKIKNGTRGEIRRIEDKADGKRLWTQAIILRMGEPPANKQVPINFTGWICMDEATKEHNIFAGVLNLTPYDAALETTAMKWHLAADKSPMIRSLSVTSVLEHGSYSEQVVAVRLMQDWKNGGQLLKKLPGYKAYEREPIDLPDSVDISDYPTKFVQIAVDNSKRGLSKFEFTLPTQVRELHCNDPVRGAEWRKMCQDFDKQ